GSLEDGGCRTRGPGERGLRVHRLGLACSSAKRVLCTSADQTRGPVAHGRGSPVARGGKSEAFGELGREYSPEAVARHRRSALVPAVRECRNDTGTTGTYDGPRRTRTHHRTADPHGHTEAPWNWRPV